MTAMSLRRDPRSLGKTEGNDARRSRTFLCRDDLYGAFERRAHELECSVDWLMSEAMKRLLADAALKGSPALPPPPPPRSVPSRLPLPPAPPLPPPPPRSRRATGSFVGEKAAVAEGIALRLGAQRVVVDRDRFVLGRSARDAHFPLRDGGVSRQHAIVERAPGGWAIVDMASTNGIHVNGVRVTRAAIRAGDVVEIGPFTIAVERA
jgi:FHA domain-containing protein